jgi:cob(I)alamin adenosyltransferase
MKIYTKTGDKGETGVIGGRVSKNSTIIESVGSLDELNASIGMITSINQDNLLNNQLFKLQNIIFCAGSVISGAKIECDFNKYTKELENEIDYISKDLKVLTNFILPGGTQISANLHLTRTICRRAERCLVRYIESLESIKPKNMKVETSRVSEIIKFVNRLSDYFFVLSRYLNKKSSVDDIYWNKQID